MPNTNTTTAITAIVMAAMLPELKARGTSCTVTPEENVVSSVWEVSGVTLLAEVTGGNVCPSVGPKKVEAEAVSTEVVSSGWSVLLVITVTVAVSVFGDWVTAIVLLFVISVGTALISDDVFVYGEVIVVTSVW